MVLFTKENCGKCDHIKGAFDLASMGIDIEVITEDNVDTLARLAWFELIDTVERGALPILVLDDGTAIDSVVPIRKYLKSRLQ